MAEGPKKFGRYFLLDLMAQGGMAEIYRARLASSEGAGRLLIIKRIQPSYGSNPEFLNMFKSEIKVTMGFNHPNIVQLYDFGEESAQPFIAMELVDGKNLRQFMTRFLDLKQRFPIDLATHIIEQAACGLHYAHCFRDKITGQPLNVVHRDISPQNLLISYEGTIKVIDFGIAKAATNSEATRAGVIKGKPSYLSPEQINGDVLDGRSDVFSLGTVLWELLAGKKLFSGDNDLAVLKLIESCQTHVKPPSTLNPNVPPELDYIVLKALAKHRDKRYQSAEEFQRALHKFLYGATPDFNPSDLAYYAKDLFKKEIVEDRIRIQRLNDEVERLLQLPEIIQEASAPRDEPTSRSEREEPAAPVATRRAPSFTMLDKPKESGVKVEFEKTVAAPAPRYRSFSNQSLPTLKRPGGMGSRQPTGHIPARRQTHTIASRPPAKRAPAIAAAVLGVMLFGNDLGIHIPFVTDLMPNLIEVVFGTPTAVVLDGHEKNVKVYVNDKLVGTSLPVTVTDVPVGAQFKLVVLASDDRSFEQDVTLRKGERQQIAVSLARRNIASKPAEMASDFPNNGPISAPPTADAHHGQKSILLRLNVMPGGSSTHVSVNGTNVSLNDPVVRVDLDSDLELIAERKGYKRMRWPFILDSRRMEGLPEWLMDVRLEPLHFGFLNLKSTPSADATITVDGQTETRKTPLDSLKLPVGIYTIKLVNTVLGMEKTVTISIQEGQVVTLDVPLDIRD